MADLHSANLGSILRDTARRRADHVALATLEGRYSYAGLWARSVRFARGLDALGVKPGDHVGILMPNNVEFASAIFGSALLGAVVVPLNTRYQGDELEFVIRNADLATVCVMSSLNGDRDLVERLHESLPGLRDATNATCLSISGLPALRNIVSFDANSPNTVIDQQRFEALAHSNAKLDPEACISRVESQDIAVICYTSGTSANPKGCMITHHAMVDGWVAGGERLRVDENDRIWAPCPLYHLTTFGPLVFSVHAGATLVTADYFEPASSLELLLREKPTVWYTGIPPIANALFGLPDYRPEDFPEARVMLNPGPRDILTALQKRFPGTAVSGYGMTEAAGLVAVNHLDESLEQRVTTTGPVVRGMELRIADPETNRPVARGEAGEIQFRGTVLSCYYRNEAATSAVKEPDGWVHSGDIGRLDPEGRLMYLSRLKDMLKVGGENVAPVEIEICLGTHSAVKLAQVVGFPDERLGEVPVAFVELRAGATATEDELLAHCESRLARFKRPRRVRFVTSWPESITLGKIRKADLRDQLLAEQSVQVG